MPTHCTTKRTNTIDRTTNNNLHASHKSLLLEDLITSIDGHHQHVLFRTVPNPQATPTTRHHKKMTDETKMKKYDIVLFGVTGFTGKLAVEYLLQRSKNDEDEYKNLKWAVSARNKSKAEQILKDIISSKVTTASSPSSSSEDDILQQLPPVLTADLLCETDDDVAKLKEIVSSTKIVLTCSGPFELYGKTLVKLCAECGVHYCDITGETDFVRGNISSLDGKAQETGACIISHCGNDCIPNDLLVLELHKLATSKNCRLEELQTYQEFNAEATMSGGTLKTAQYQLGKNRNNRKDGGSSFDPLLTKPDGTKSEYALKNISPKGSVPVKELDGNASPWIMGPVMVNCVKRSNALLGYAPTLRYGDARLSVTGQSWSEWGQQTIKLGVIAAAVALPSVFGSLGPKPGEGPTRENMEAGYLKLHALGTMVSNDDSGSEDDKKTEKKIKGLFQFNKDTGYLYTAVLLVETGMTLLSKMKSKEGLKGGCLTPASALGSDLTQRILKEMDTSLEVSEVEN